MKPLWALLLGLWAGSALAAEVATGLDVIKESSFAPLWGKRVGVIVNATSVDTDGRTLVELLRATPGVTLAAIFSPEHGFTGRVEHGRPVAHGRYLDTDIPIFSLYGDTRRPTADMLRGIDTLVFDIQDVGARFYTYITTLAYALEEADRADKEFVVLDRPNPLGGAVVEGVVLSTAVRHFTAYYSVPTRHGMTVGELARWHVAEAGLSTRLLVIPMRGWNRAMLWEDTGLSWTAPSPNIKSPRTALLYAGLGAFESTNVSVGRGTETPFEVFGAPWLRKVPLAARLNALRLPGVKFQSVVFRPKSDRYQGERCYGVRVKITNPRRFRPVDVFVHAACLIRDARKKDFLPRWAEMPRVVGSNVFQTLFESGVPASDLLQGIHDDADFFYDKRAPFLLY